MEKYLKTLFGFMDAKGEKILERERMEIALKKGLLYDEKKYKVLTKKDIF
jgi:hypothetical protein